MHEKDQALSWADRITIARMIGAPLLLTSALLGQPQVFLALAIGGLISDIGDGKVARLLNHATPRGARLDSRADLMFYSAAIIGMVALFPAQFAAQWRTVAVVGLAYAVPILFGLLKFRRLTSYHTWMARVALCATAGAFFFWLWMDSIIFLRVATTILVISAIEEMAITWKLVIPRDNLSHFFQLLPPGFRRNESCLSKQLES